MSHFLPNPADRFLTRRGFLSRCGMGMGSLALANMIGETAAFAADANSTALNPLSPRKPHFAPKAKRVIHIFANGGCSHVDTFDPKPALDKYHGQPIPVHLKTERKTGAAMKSPFAFKKYGKSGIPVSD
jgi:hypothetical protein